MVNADYKWTFGVCGSSSDDAIITYINLAAWIYLQQNTVLSFCFWICCKLQLGFFFQTPLLPVYKHEHFLPWQQSHQTIYFKFTSNQELFNELETYKSVYCCFRCKTNEKPKFQIFSTYITIYRCASPHTGGFQCSYKEC